MIGAGICAVSLIVTSFVTSLDLMFFTFTLWYGLGMALAYTTTVTIPVDYFKKHRNIATGIGMSGSAFGTLIMLPIAQGGINSVGWRWSMRIISALCVLGVACAAVIKPLPKKAPSSEVLKPKTSFAKRFVKDMQLWKNKVFDIWVITFCLMQFGFYIPYVHLVS